MSNDKCIHGSKCKGECMDPNVENGMTTNTWGPPGWHFLHCVAHGFPFMINDNNPKHFNKRNDYANFFYYLGKVLPCKYCRDSYMDFIKEVPIDNMLDTRKDLCKWLYDIHNKVNEKLGVPDCDIPTFEEVYNKYEQFRAKCKKTTDEERETNRTKGCIDPADNTKKKCILKIVECGRADITRRDNSNISKETKLPKPEDYILIKKNHIYLTIIMIVCLYVFYKYKNDISKKLIKLGL